MKARQADAKCGAPRGAVPETTVVLASSSPFRKALLERLMIPFLVADPAIDETPKPHETPPELVERLAIEKAQTVATRHPQALVIGSDQVAVHGAKIVGKPENHAAAIQQLRDASGQNITLYTGLAVIDRTGRIQSDIVPYSVQFRVLDDHVIERYLRKEQPYGCSGSLRADGLGIALLERFEGDDPTALIGLPLIRLVRMLEHAGMRVV